MTICLNYLNVIFVDILQKKTRLMIILRKSRDILFVFKNIKAMKKKFSIKTKTLFPLFYFIFSFLNGTLLTIQNAKTLSNIKD